MGLTFSFVMCKRKTVFSFIWNWCSYIYLCHMVLSYVCLSLVHIWGQPLTSCEVQIYTWLPGGHLSGHLVDTSGFSDITWSAKYILVWSGMRHILHKTKQSNSSISSLSCFKSLVPQEYWALNFPQIKNQCIDFYEIFYKLFFDMIA